MGFRSTGKVFTCSNVVVTFFLCFTELCFFHWCNLLIPLQGKPGFPGIQGQKGSEGLVGRDGQPGLDGFPGPQVR